MVCVWEVIPNVLPIHFDHTSTTANSAKSLTSFPLPSSIEFYPLVFLNIYGTWLQFRWIFKLESRVLVARVNRRFHDTTDLFETEIAHLIVVETKY